MRLVIIGAVAAGTSAAAKARRNDENIEIVIYEKDEYISYSGCGMPYYIGGEVDELSKLTPRNAAFFKSKYNVDIFIGHKVTSINPQNKTLKIYNINTKKTIIEEYDKLIIATGAISFKPNIQGMDLEHVFTLRNIGDMNGIKEYIDRNKPKSAVIIGTGFIGLEVCENLKKLGMDITLVERLPQVTPGLDSDMAQYVEAHIKSNDVKICKGVSAAKIEKDKVVLEDATNIQADLVLVSAGVKPNVNLAVEAGVELGITKAIKVDNQMMTNISDIYACGDCIEQYHLVTGNPVYRPMGSTANKTGRIAGDVATGGDLSFRGILGTGIFKIFGMTVALTGLSEREARIQGFDTEVCHNIKPNKPEYMGGKEMVIKGIADRESGRLLGTQIVGYEGVDKRIDVFATAITYKALVRDLFHLDLAYAPPFSTTKDPVMYTGMILDNAIYGNRKLMTSEELFELIDSDKEYQLIDTRVGAQYEKAHIDTAINKPHAHLREALEEFDKDKIIITYCNKGVTGNATQNIFLNHGFKKVYNLSGGHKNYVKTIDLDKK